MSATLMTAPAGAPAPAPVPGPGLAVRTSPLPAETLLGLSRRGLVEASAAGHPGDRYAAAHLAALRAAAAVLACRARPAPTAGRRARPTSAWVLLAAVAPELVEWADFFAAGARKRAAAEAGVATAVTARDADDLLRDAQTFLAVVETTLGLAHQPLLATS
jgi:hypothetical protein